jgi:Protein of unknown function (DUF1573)
MGSNDDEWGTINVRGEQALSGRDIEQLRSRYRQHQDALTQLARTAPTEALARHYNELNAGIERSIQKLGELERGGTAPAAAASAEAAAADRSEPNPTAERTWNSIIPAATAAGRSETTTAPLGNGARVIAIIAIGAFVLVLLAFLGWRYSRNHTTAGTIIEQKRTDTAPAVDTAAKEAVPPAAVAAISVSPTSADFGVVRKGTRVVKKFEITNSGDTKLTLSFARSQCRCLWFDTRPAVVPPKGKAAMSITVDGAKAKKGPLAETVSITSKENPSESATVDVKARID